MSRRPNRATVLSTRARTSSSLRTSALMNLASEPKARSSLTSASPAWSRRPARTTLGAFPGERDGGGAPDAGQIAVDQHDWVAHLPSSNFAALPAEYGSGLSGRG